MSSFPYQGCLDAHLHLQDERYAGLQDSVIYRAASHGVGMMFCNATCEKDWEQVLQLAEKHAAVIPFLGIHPWYADSVSLNWQQQLGDLIEKTGCGIGEIGLDRGCGVDLGQQQAIFRGQLELAADNGRPVVIHCVRSWGMLLDMLEPLCTNSALRFMVHSFAGSVETMQRLVNLGGYISYSMAMLRQGREKLRSTFVQTPLERVLLETDAPDQGVFSLCRGEIDGCNEPICVVELYRMAAGMKNMQLDEFESIIRNNGTIFTNQATTR